MRVESAKAGKAPLRALAWYSSGGWFLVAVGQAGLRETTVSRVAAVLVDEERSTGEG